jgi:signal transduction histidine kinase
MIPADDVLFNEEVWRPALEKFAAVTQLTVNVYGVGERVVCGPIHSTPLFAMLMAHGYEPGIFLDCARQCLAQTAERPAVIVAPAFGFGVVGTSLMLDGEVVGAAVAGYALVDFARRADIERLSRVAGVSFQQLWEVARTHQPVPARRLLLHGELLQVLADTILRENYRTRLYEETAAELTAAAAAKDEFLAVLSHELRTPLTPILGWARMLRQADPANVARAAEVIERNALLQVRLVEDLLELTRVAHGKVTLDMKICDLRDAIRAAREAFGESALQKGVALDIVPVDGASLVKADPNRLQQVIRNVLSNAVKFTPAGGRVTVALKEEGGSAVVTILDTGEGISAEFLPLVFDMFRQQEHGLHRTHDGLGIGLALVRALTELQGGQVTVASEGPGRGTGVTMAFPLAADVELTAPVGPDAGGRVRTLKGLTILVVENVDDARESTRVMLEHFGARVLVASNGREALAMVDRGRPDVVLCDLRMPHMDGFEFIKILHLRSRGRGLPVIAVSALASSADHVRTQAAGFDAHLDKPFDDVALLAAIGGAMVHRSGR